MLLNKNHILFFYTEKEMAKSYDSPYYKVNILNNLKADVDIDIVINNEK